MKSPKLDEAQRAWGPRAKMTFPEDWGPPPQFSALRVTAEGVPLTTHTKPHPGAVDIKAEKPTSSASSSEDKLNEDPNGEHIGDEATFLFAAEGCPSASNDMLVKKGEYEGGFSIWECTWDLLGFLQKPDKEASKEARRMIASGHVLDLGCGHGLLGIWALKNGASAVVFQDLNGDVLNSATRWNILKNTEGDRLKDALPHQHELSVSIHEAFPSFAAADSRGIREAPVDMESATQNGGSGQGKTGDSFPLLNGRALCVAASWEKYPQICCSCRMEASGKTTSDSEAGREAVPVGAQNGAATESVRQFRTREIQFSIIFCSEGIYREETFKPLAELFKRLLRRDGIALVASKRYYFGVGGGSLAFISFIREKYADNLSVEVADSFRGVNSNNFRDVLLIRKTCKAEAQM